VAAAQDISLKLERTI